MKKVVLVSLAVAVAVTNSLAQVHPAEKTIDMRNKVAFGLKVGANLSNVYDTDGDDFKADAKVGFATGAFVSIPIGTYVGIQPEILFSQKGFRATGGRAGNYYSITRTTN